MHSKRNLSLALALLLSVSAILLAVGCSKGGDDTYKIGALFAVTGFNSPLGTPEKDTAVMLEKQINAAGGIKGKKVQIIVYDTESDETKAVTFAKKSCWSRTRCWPSSAPALPARAWPWWTLSPRRRRPSSRRRPAPGL